MAARHDQGLVCDKCLEASPTKKQLVSLECFDYKAHKQKRRLVRVQWTGSRLIEVSRRRSTSYKSSIYIRPMPDVPGLKGRFILCDMARCKGEHCTHPHSVEERDAWNEELLGKDYKGSATEKKKRIAVEFHKLLRNSPNLEISLRSFQQTYQTFYRRSFRISDYISDENAGIGDFLSQCEGIQVQVKTIKGKKESFVCLSSSLEETESQGTTKGDEKPPLPVKGNEPEWPSLTTSSPQQGSQGPVSAWDKPLQSKIGAKFITNKADIPPVKSETKGKADCMQPQLKREPTSLISSYRDIKSLPKQGECQMTLPLIIPKPSTDMSQMIAGHGCIDTTPQELSRSDPVEFQFPETKEEASVDFVFQSQPVEELNVYENQNKPGQIVSQPSSQYLMFDDPCIISHMQVNNSAINSQSIAMVATQNGTPILQNENALNLSMRMEPQMNWPDFEPMPVGTTSVQGSPGPTHQLYAPHGLLQPPIGVNAYNTSTIVTTSMSATPASMPQLTTPQIQCTHLPVQVVPPSNVIKHNQVLSQSSYKDVLKSCLSGEQTVHKTELAKCNGEYTMFLYNQGYRPYEMYDYEADQFGYLKGLKSGHIVYTAQASQCVSISKLEAPHKEICSAQIPRSNLSHFEEVLYVALDSNNSRAVRKSFPHARKSQKVYVNFKLKDSYFPTLKQSVSCLPVEIIQRILPDTKHFYNHHVSNSEVDLGGCERYCLPDHGQLSALKMIVSCPASGPPVLVIGPFGAGKSRILAVAALYFMQARNGSPSRVLVCMQQRASVESFLGSFSSLIASKEHMEICVVQNYGKLKNESLKKWYATVDDFKQSYWNGLKYNKPFLVITTCMTSRSLVRFLPRDFFTHIMLDEAAQMREPENIIPLCLATPSTKIVVAGDPNQVGPATLVLGDKTQLSTSLLERLHSTYVQLGDLASSHLVTLMNNYRCNDSILQLVGELYYDFPLMWAGHQPSPALHPDAPYPLLFICSSVDENECSMSTVNRREAEIVLEELVDKANRWPPAWRAVDLSQFCVMSPNRSQMTLIQRIIREKKLTNQLKSLFLLTTTEIQGREYRGIFLSTSEPMEEDGSSIDHRKSLADRYVFNTAITRAQSLVVSVGNPFLLLRLEKHMIQRYGEKGKCWSSYLKHCLEKGTLIFDKSLGLAPDDEASCLSKIQSLVEEQYKPSTEIVEEMVEKERISLEHTQMQEVQSTQFSVENFPQPIIQPQILPQSTLSQLNQQPGLEYQLVQQNYSSQSILPPVSAYFQQKLTNNTGFQAMQSSQPVLYPTDVNPQLQSTNSGFQAMQSSQPVLYPTDVNPQLHSTNSGFQAMQSSQPVLYPTDVNPQLHSTNSGFQAMQSSQPVLYPTDVDPQLHSTNNGFQAMQSSQPVLYPTDVDPQLHSTNNGFQAMQSSQPVLYPTDVDPQLHSTNSGFQAMQSSQPVLYPTDVNPQLHSTNSGFQAMQSSQPVLYPTDVNPQLHSTNSGFQAMQSSQPVLYSTDVNPQLHSTNSGFQAMQSSQPVMYPTAVDPQLHSTNSGFQAMQSSQPVLYPTAVDPQLHSIYMHNQNHQHQARLAQATMQTNYPNSLFNVPLGQHHPTMPLGEPNLHSQALNPFDPHHGNLHSVTDSQLSPTNFPDAHSLPENKEIVTQAVSQAHVISPTTGNTSVPCSIHIRNITERYDEETIRLYFESARFGGDEVTSVDMLGDGAAVVTFMNHEVIETVLQKSHLLFGLNTTVTKHHVVSSDPIQPCSSQNHEENQLQEQFGDLTVIQEHQIQNIVEPVTSCSSIRLSNVTQHYDSDYIELYFERFASTKDSVQVEMTGNGEAIIHFDNSEDVETTLQGTLDKFGEKANAERILQDTTLDSQTKGQIEINIQQLKAECLAKDPSGLQEHLSSLHVQITVDAGQGNLGKVMITPTKLTKAEWQEEAKQQVETYTKSKLLARTKKTQLANSNEGIAELREYVNKLKEKGCFAYEFKKENAQLRIAGDEESVKQCESKMKEIVEGFKMVETGVPLSHESYDYLKRIKLSEIERTFPEVSVTHDPKAPALKLKGVRRAVEKFKSALVEDGVHMTLQVHANSQIVIYFQTKKGKFLLKELLKDSVCLVVPRFLKCDQTSSITLNLLCDPSQKSAASRVVESLQQAIDIKRIPLPESLVMIKDEVTEEYTTLCNGFEEKYSVVVEHSEEDISFAGKKEDVSQCIFEIRAFIKLKCTVREDISFEMGVWRLLIDHLNEKWVDITTHCKQTEVQLKTPKVSKACTNLHVTLTGDRIPVKKIYDAVSELLQNISREIILVERPGTMKYFQSRGATGSLKSIEAERKVVIEVIDPNKVIEDTIIDKAPETCKYTRKHLASLDGGKQIMIFVGDITDFNQADVLVNAANVNLEHIGGVAKAISDKGGPIIQDESRWYVKQNGKLQTGDAWLTTTAGGLPCKALVHTVGPIWVGGKKNEEAQLVNACMKTLTVVNDNGYSSVAFPAISAGIYGYPIDQCARVMIRSIITFYKDFPNSSIQDYYIVLLKNEDAIPFIATLKQFLPASAEKDDLSTKHPPFPEPSKLKTWSLPATQRDDHPKYRSFQEPSGQQLLEELLPGTENTYPSPNYQPIPEPSVPKPVKRNVHQTTDTDHTKSEVLEYLKLHKGSIVKIKADVYVNTTNRDLNLSGGAVSKALLKEAGERLQLECTQKAPIGYGEIAVTGPGNLQCQYVLHTVLPNYDSGAAERVLRRVICKCMQTCSQLGMQSIAFPAIGTGNLGYPDDFVAKIVVEEISQSLMHNPTNILVHLVIFMESTYVAFRKELQSLGMSLKQQRPPQAALTSNFSAKMRPYIPKATRGQEMYTKRAFVPAATNKKSASSSASTQCKSIVPLPAPSLALSLHSTAVQHTDKQTVTYIMRGQRLAVTIVNGDITEETSDVIVNCTNSQLMLGAQGVAGALRQKGSPQLQQLCDIEMEKSGQLLGGDRIIETQATGSLKCKSIFHVHFDCQTPAGFVKLVMACLQRAQAKGYSTVSFPAIGTGGGGYPPEAAASGMLKAINDFSQHYLSSQLPCSVKNVRIVVFNDTTLFSTFVTTFKSRVSTTHEQPSLSEPLTASTLETKSSDSEDEIATASVSPPENLEETEETPPSVEHSHISDEEENGDEIHCEEKLEIKIYGENEDVVKAARKEVQDMIDENLVDDTIENPIAEKLSRAERSGLLREGKKHNVMLIIDEDSQQSIRLSGCKDDVAKVKLHIALALTRLKEKITIGHAAEHLYRTIRWKKGGSSGSEYDRGINYDIELAYNDRKMKSTYSHGTSKTTMYFTIDFHKMEETDHHANDACVKVVRVNKEMEELLQKGELPTHWSPMPVDRSTDKEQTLHSVPLVPNSDEYIEIKSEFDKTMKSDQPSAYYGARRYFSGSSYGSIVKILRIQNPVLYATYLARKRLMEKHNPSGNVIERRLFHGTSGDTCPTINRSGFNRSYAGKNATALGRGVYFAQDATYSAANTYSPPDHRGQKHIYFARVLTGEYTVGNHSMIEPPLKDQQDVSGSRYDSVANSIHNPSMFVIFNDTSVYPEYLIVFTLLY